MRWPWRRLREGGPVPAVGDVLVFRGERFIPDEHRTFHAPERLDACALDVAGPDGSCPYCGASSGEPHHRPVGTGAA